MARQTRNSSRTTRTLLAPLTAGLVGTLMLAGCVSYTNVPEPESAPAFKSANHSQAIRVTRVALEEVIGRYPMSDDQGRYSVNLPAGTTIESAQKIIEHLPEGAVLPYEGMDESVPVYHIGRIWIRASDAKVDVLYPARSFDGTEFTGNVTVWLNGGVQRWRVSRVQHWAPGTIGVPPLYIPITQEELDRREMIDDDEPIMSEPEPAAEPEETEIETPEASEEAEPEESQVAPETGGQYRQVPVDD